MNLRSIDLNLLVALDALLHDRHVTRAAERVGLSQPAMSNALSRLRATFGDELLVRTAAGMVPTPRALELTAPLRQILRQVERVLASDSGFDPVGSDRTFVVRMSDILACLMLPLLMARKSVDSGLAYNILHLSPAETVEALERDEIDIAISMGLDHPASIRSERLLSDRMVCLMRKAHPVAKRFTLKAFVSQPQMKVSMSPTDLRFVDDVLSELGHRRTIALNVPHWLVVPHVLKQTDLIAVMPRHLATTLMDDGLQMRDLPFRSTPFEWKMYWHRRHDRSKASLWLRNEFRQVCAKLSVIVAPRPSILQAPAEQDSGAAAPRRAQDHGLLPGSRRSHGGRRG